MKHQHDIVDITSYIENKQKPATLIKRDKHTWLVRDLPLDVSSSVSQEWGWVRTDDWVRVPLYPHLCSSEPAVALAYAFQLGVRACDLISDAYVIDTLYIAIGAPVQEITQESSDGKEHTMFRFWLGFAFILKTV